CCIIHSLVQWLRDRHAAGAVSGVVQLPDSQVKRSLRSGGQSRRLLRPGHRVPGRDISVDEGRGYEKNDFAVGYVSGNWHAGGMWGRWFEHEPASAYAGSATIGNVA